MGLFQFVIFLIMISIYVGISGLLVARLLGHWTALTGNR
jgi:hypothetical protein